LLPLDLTSPSVDCQAKKTCFKESLLFSLVSPTSRLDGSGLVTPVEEEKAAV